MTDNIKSILEDLKARKVRITVDGENLQLEAGKGVMDDSLKQQIKTHKAALVSYIRQVKEQGGASIPLAPVSDGYPLSSSQRRLWVLAQFEESSVAYNIPGIYLFEGTLDIAALEQAFNRLIARHEILRTVFKEQENGEIRQFIYDGATAPFRIIQGELRYAGDQQEAIAQLVNTICGKPFDLAADVLLRAGLYRIADERWILVSAMHHIISDGWSMNILLHELLHLYEGALNGKAALLAPLPIQYKDYAVWQQQQLRDKALQSHKEYWLQQFSGELPLLELPGDHTRPVMKTYRGGLVRTTINRQLTNTLQQLVQDNGATLFMGLLAAVSALLYRYTQQEDMILGTLTAGRIHTDLNEQIGFYVNTLGLRIKQDGNRGYRELLQDIRTVASAAYAHQAYPFDELLEELQLRRDTSRNPLFDVLVVLQHTSPEEQTPSKENNGLAVSRYASPAGSGQSKFDLSFDFLEITEGIQLSLEYNRDIYGHPMALQIAAHLEQLLAGMLLTPDKPVYAIDYLSDTEKHLLLEDFNNTGEEVKILMMA
jgi:hypothetical protein